MKRFLMAAVLSMSLTGCSLLAAIQNPIRLNQLYTIQAAYGLALSGAVAYRSLPLCKKNEAPAIGNVCAKREVVLKLQAADRKAQGAITAASNFVRNYPDLNAVTFIAAAQKAVEDFQDVQESYGVSP